MLRETSLMLLASICLFPNSIVKLWAAADGSHSSIVNSSNNPNDASGHCRTTSCIHWHRIPAVRPWPRVRLPPSCHVVVIHVLDFNSITRGKKTDRIICCTVVTVGLNMSATETKQFTLDNAELQTTASVESSIYSECSSNQCYRLSCRHSQIYEW